MSFGVVRAPVTAHLRRDSISGMSTVDPNLRASPPQTTPADYGTYEERRGSGWLLFAGIIMMLVGILNVIYGIAAIGKSSFFVNDARYIISNLTAWGWVTLIIGAIQIGAAYSIWRGDQFGRWFGILFAGLSAIAALLSIPAYPFWSLAIFTLDVLVIYGLAAYGGRHEPV